MIDNSLDDKVIILKHCWWHGKKIASKLLSFGHGSITDGKIDYPAENLGEYDWQDAKVDVSRPR